MIKEFLKTGRIDWWSDQLDEQDVEYTYLLKTPFTIYRRVDEHVEDLTWSHTFYKRYFWQVEWKYRFNREEDEGDNFFAPSQEVICR
jgi:hypothetical protein|tara:strand:- start:154 stop:414 length:261 start_codon:yes stop_codon:yes gene_type:complete